MGTTANRGIRGRRVAALLMAVGGLLALAAPHAGAAEDKLSKETTACLKCHDDPALETKLGDGKRLALHVSTKAFLASVHKEQDCTDCHADLDDKTHGKVRGKLKSERELTASMQDSCVDCHKKKYKQYDDSIHATLAKDGNDKAPLCASCHNAHTQVSVKVAAPIEQTPCASCHEEIFKAYAQDVHGLQRTAQGGKAPICADCHQAHAVKAASLDDTPRDACLSCHKDAFDAHAPWLPNAGLHFESISCAVCHAPDAERRVNLRLFDGASKQPLREKVGVPQFVRRVGASETAGLGLDERALWSLLTQFNADGATGPGKVVLRGRLEVRSGVHAHRLAEKGKAVRDCKTCHAFGAEPFQSVVLSIAGPDGRPLRHGVQKDVLTSLTAMQSVRGFYAIGSTRIKLLDVLLVLAVAGSIAGCLAHMAMRRLTRSARERREAAARAAAAPAAPAPPPDAGGSP